MRVTKTFCMAAVVLLAACSSGPPPADWQVEAKGAMDRAVAAYLQGNSRVEQAELVRVRAALASTGRADLLANAELRHCASRVASLVFEPCLAFEAVRADATAPQRAYAAYLRGQLQPQDAALLPEAQRGNADEAARLQRRIALGEGSVNNAAQPAAKRASAP